MTIYRLGQHAPEIDASAFVADSATVIGRVSVGPRASLWYGTTLRGDNELIVIGADSNVQEGAVLHTDPGFPLTVGTGVTIGHQAMLHGCSVGDGALIGIQAVVLNGAVIGRGCLVGAGALVTEGKRFDDHMLILGAPAKAVRALTGDEIIKLQSNAANYVARGALFKTQLHKIG